MKGLAIYEDKLYAPTADGHIVALDVKTGDLRWDRAVVTAEQGVAPRPVRRRLLPYFRRPAAAFTAR